MRYRVTHRTLYTYTEAVGLCYNEAYLLPRSLPRQQCLRAQLRVEPVPAVQRERLDVFGNRVCHFAIQGGHRRLTVTAVSEVEMQAPPALDTTLAWEVARDQLGKDCSLTGLEARQFLLTSPFVTVDDAVRDYAATSFSPGRPLLEVAEDLTARIFTDFSYDPGFTTIVTPLSEVLEHRRGVCQDFAHLQIACLRSMGISARYVSGYLETLPPPGKPKLRGADASHAWLAVYIPNTGWVDFDPTNNRIPDIQHVTTAWGRDYGDVAPLKGVVFGGGDHQLDVAVDVDRLT